jgi:hypothetical protein
VRFRILGTAWRFDVNADAKGRFVVRLVDVLPGVCGVRALRGTGTSGSRTILKGLRLGVCAPGKPALDGCAGPVTFPSGPCVPPPRR